jgi:hypothetical protein
MEHRTELEQILLAGLPEQERKETLKSMRQATAKKLSHLRSVANPDDRELTDSSVYERDELESSF